MYLGSTRNGVEYSGRAQTFVVDVTRLCNSDVGLMQRSRETKKGRSEKVKHKDTPEHTSPHLRIQGIASESVTIMVQPDLQRFGVGDGTDSQCLAALTKHDQGIGLQTYGLKASEALSSCMQRREVT